MNSWRKRNAARLVSSSRKAEGRRTDSEVVIEVDAHWREKAGDEDPDYPEPWSDFRIPTTSLNIAIGGSEPRT